MECRDKAVPACLRTCTGACQHSQELHTGEPPSISAASFVTRDGFTQLRCGMTNFSVPAPMQPSSLLGKCPGAKGLLQTEEERHIETPHCLNHKTLV